MHLSDFLIPQPAPLKKKKTGSNTGKEKIFFLYFPELPESSSSKSSRNLSGPALYPPAATVTTSDGKVSARLWERQEQWQNIRGEEKELTEWERQRESVCSWACRRCQNPKACSAWGLFQFVSASASDLVIDVGRALRRHLLNDVDRVAVIAADLLIMRAEDTVSSPERDDDVAGLWAIIVPAASAPFGRGQGAQRQRSGMLRRVLAMPPPVLEQEQDQHNDDDDENDAARGDAHEDGHVRAHHAGGLPSTVVVAFSRCYIWKTEGRRILLRYGGEQADVLHHVFLTTQWRPLEEADATVTDWSLSLEAFCIESHYTTTVYAWTKLIGWRTAQEIPNKWHFDKIAFWKTKKSGIHFLNKSSIWRKLREKYLMLSWHQLWKPSCVVTPSDGHSGSHPTLKGGCFFFSACSAGLVLHCTDCSARNIDQIFSI